jgi:hypothetical protein
MPRYTVTVDEGHLDHVDEVADALRAASIRVDGVHPGLGIVTVVAEQSSVAEIESVTGVESVTEEVDYQLPPPDAEIQ